MMKLGEIARTFGMTIGQFATIIGYSRQSLHEGISMTPKAKAAVAKLHTLNAVMLKMDQEEAQRKFEARENAVKEFEKSILKRVKSDGYN